MANVSHVSRGRQYRLFVDDDAAVAAVAEPAPEALTLVEVPSDPIAVREVLGLPARLLGELPAAATLVCEHIDAGRVVLTTSPAVHAASVGLCPTFTGRELAALALAAEHDRASAEVFGVWCARKQEARSWRLTAAEALGPVTGAFVPRGWSIGRVLGWYAVRVLSVGVGDEVPS